jgi:Spy/CpxP family protein refolding chaperone
MNRIFWVVLVFAMLALPAYVIAGEPDAKGDDKGKTEHRRPPMGMVGKFILDHAKELAVTDEQKAKIEAILKEHQDDAKPPKAEGKPEPKPEGKAEGKHGKGPFADILTEEQHNKLREMLKTEMQKLKQPPADK